MTLTAYEAELLRWAKAGGHGEPPRQTTRRSRSSDPLVERMVNMDWDALADRTQPLNLPPGVSLEAALEFFGKLRVVEAYDRYGWWPNQR